MGLIKALNMGNNQLKASAPPICDDSRVAFNLADMESAGKETVIEAASIGVAAVIELMNRECYVNCYVHQFGAQALTLELKNNDGLLAVIHMYSMVLPSILPSPRCCSFSHLGGRGLSSFAKGVDGLLAK